MGGWLQYTGFPTRRIIKKKTVQENHFHNVLCLSEAKGMDISMKKVYIFSMFLFIFWVLS